MSTDQTQIYEVVGASLTNNINEHEKEMLDNWLSESEDNRKSYFLIKEMWENTSIVQEHSNANELYNKVEKKIKVDSLNIGINFKRVAKYAAVAALFIISTYFTITSNFFQFNQGEAELSFVEKINPAGKKSRIVLSDGSIVILNAQSSVKYSSNFTQNPREISLIGEAHFDIAHDASNPFVVITDNIRTTALGTSFNIKSYPSENDLRISLITGKVRVEKYDGDENSGKPTETYLVAGEEVVYNKEIDQVQKGVFSMESVSWKDGTLFFDHSELQHIMTTLERWYAVDIVVSGSLDNPQYFSGSFKNKSLESVLDAMSFSKKFDYTIEGKLVSIEYKNNN